MTGFDLLDDPSPLAPHSPDERASVVHRGIKRRRQRQALLAVPVVIAALAVVPLVRLGTGGHDDVVTPAVTPTPPAVAHTYNGIDGEQYGNASIQDGPPTGRFTELDNRHPVTVNGFTLDVPRGWERHDVSLPSDHTDVLFIDPDNVAARIEVSTSGCSVCLRGLDNHTPDPAKVVPSKATSSYTISSTERGFAEPAWQGYEVNGVALVLSGGSGDDTGVMVRVALPANYHSVATGILNSVH